MPISANSGEEKKESEMDNIAGLLSLMQANKNMDIPGLLALCKDKGYDKAMGSEWMFLFVFFLIFMWGGGGWGNLNRGQQQQAADFAAAAGINLQDIIAVSDRISQAQAQNMQGFNDVTASSTAGFRDVQSTLCQGFNGINTGMLNGFNQLDTKICASIAEVISAVRTQADRNYEATRNVGEQISQCCCALNNKLDQVLCKTEGLYSHTSLVGERIVNAMDKQFCYTDQKIDALKSEMLLGFERVNCNIVNTAKEQEVQRLNREVAELKSNQNNSIIATSVASNVMSQVKDLLASTKSA